MDGYVIECAHIKKRPEWIYVELVLADDSRRAFWALKDDAADSLEFGDRLQLECDQVRRRYTAAIVRPNNTIPLRVHGVTGVWRVGSELAYWR